jgi:pimeloyl-ACP methyl ester carboxylesterase
MADVVLLHGSWLGGWMWADVEALLTAEGLTVAAPTLSSSDLDNHVREVGRLLGSAGGTVLVGHSYSGMVATATAAAHPDLIRKVIYLDAYVPRGGQCAFDVLPSIRAAFEANLDGDGNVLPLPLSAFGVTDQRIAAPIESRLRPWPLVTHEQTSPGLPDRIDRVYLQCAQAPFFSELANELDSQGWPVERLNLLHLCPITHPAETAAALRPHISA